MTAPRTLDIEEDLNFQRKEWFWQRIGVALLLLFVAGALLGLTGMGGPLSHGQAGEPGDAIHVEYERVVRRGAIATITLHLRNTPRDVQFWVSAPYFDEVRLESMAPQPELVSVEGERYIYTVRTGSQDVTVTLQVEHETVGRIDGEAGLIGGPSVRFSQVSLF